MIRVEYPDGTQQMVNPYELNQLIANRAISRFERSAGWAVLDENASVRRAAVGFGSREGDHPSAA